jgi:hypothetical protein
MIFKLTGAIAMEYGEIKWHSKVLRMFATYTSENPLMCRIFICFIIVVLPDSPVPVNRKLILTQKETQFTFS